jgi:hypothetical protein
MSRQPHIPKYSRPNGLRVGEMGKGKLCMWELADFIGPFNPFSHSIHHWGKNNFAPSKLSD